MAIPANNITTLIISNEEDERRWRLRSSALRRIDNCVYGPYNNDGRPLIAQALGFRNYDHYRTTHETMDDPTQIDNKLNAIISQGLPMLLKYYYETRENQDVCCIEKGL